MVGSRKYCTVWLLWHAWHSSSTSSRAVSPLFVLLLSTSFFMTIISLRAGNFHRMNLAQTCITNWFQFIYLLALKCWPVLRLICLEIIAYVRPIFSRVFFSWRVSTNSFLFYFPTLVVFMMSIYTSICPISRSDTWWIVISILTFNLLSPLLLNLIPTFSLQELRK
jgi:hypothetical protein